MPIISFIVPVFNVEKYLRRCIDSILNQDMQDELFEIILVDDGSPDNCGMICDEYSELHGNIHTIHKANGGLSDARNTGVAASKGDFIQFVDSDDYLAPGCVPSLLAQIKSQNLDVLRFDYANVNEAEEVIYPSKNPKLFANYSPIVADGLSFLSEKLGYECYACQFVLKRHFAQDFPFMPGIHFEDTEWVSRMLPNASRVSSNPIVAYFYRMRRGSITKGKDKELIRKNIEDRLKIIALLQERKQNAADKKWFDGMISHMTVSLLGSTCDFLYHERRNILESLCNLHVYPLSKYKMTKQAKRKIGIINFSPGFYCFLYHGILSMKSFYKLARS